MFPHVQVPRPVGTLQQRLGEVALQPTVTGFAGRTLHIYTSTCTHIPIPIAAHDQVRACNNAVPAAYVALAAAATRSLPHSARTNGGYKQKQASYMRVHVFLAVRSAALDLHLGAGCGHCSTQSMRGMRTGQHLVGHRMHERHGR